MADNSKNMSLEDKIVQTLKDEKLYALIGDEDAISTLVKRALHEALYQPKRALGFNSRIEESDSIVVATAKKVAGEAAAKLTQTLIDEMLANPEVRKAIMDAIIAFMPEAIRKGINQSYDSMMQMASMDAMNKMQETMRNMHMR